MHKPPLEDFFDMLSLYRTISHILIGTGFVVALLLLAYLAFPRLR